ncbi:MAG TPA: ASKHA domain-containing protein [Ilumatobacteraceae bacterium]|nr:ASKHA domain-containing protein [Ilumatobacteraceae bacterium]
MPRIVFTPSGLAGEVDTGTTVLTAARQLGVDLDSVCGGRGICGRCQVEPSTGSFAKWAIDSQPTALSDWSSVETDYETKGNARRPLREGRRLGCAAQVLADAVIAVPSESQVHKQVVRKSVDLTGLVIDPQFRLYNVDVPKAVLGDSESLSELIGEAVARTHGVAVRSWSTTVLRAVHRAAANDHGSVTLAVDGDAMAVAIWPGFVDTALGVAIDVGSTTVAGHLCDLSTGEVLATAGMMNPQIRFGEDLMSRVSFVMMNPGGDNDLTSCIRRALNELITDLLHQADAPADELLDIVIVGNPIMHHIVLGIDPTPLGQAPFTLASAEALHTSALDIGLDFPTARVFVGPCIAGHVGADTTAAMLAEGPHRSEHWQLLIDVGTNAEIVLGCTERQFAASSPTGPAFEGAQISCGQRATAGAIERVRIDRTTLAPRFKVIGCDLWSDEPGFTAATESLTISGVCGSGIIEVIGEMYLAGVIDAEGVVRGEAAATCPHIVADDRTFRYVLHRTDEVELSITQNDVRAIQLAKAALRAGIELLMSHAGVDTLTDVRLAGAFGAHIDPLYALVLGLVPDAPVEAVRSVGNAAGAGAVRALLSMQARAELEAAARAVIKIETATEPTFQELFVAAMAFPHASAPSPYLGAVVTLPERTSSVDAIGGRRRRRQENRS